MPGKTETSLRAQREVPAAPEAVFDAWLDPAMLRCFLGQGTETEGDIRVAPEEGGAFEVPGAGGGVFRDLARPERLAFTWAAPGGGESLVVLEFAPKDNGTLVTLRQRTLAEEAEAGTVDWNAVLERLARELS